MFKHEVNENQKDDKDIDIVIEKEVNEDVNEAANETHNDDNDVEGIYFSNKLIRLE